MTLHLLNMQNRNLFQMDTFLLLLNAKYQFVVNCLG